MQIDELDLEGGTFKVNLPYNWVGWLVWAIGLVLVIAGVVLMITNSVPISSDALV